MSRTHKTERLDLEMLKRGLAKSREKAKVFIMEGSVFVNGMRAIKASQKVHPQDRIDLKISKDPFVSRGGLKLEGALDHFHIDVHRKVALDVGSSTGGFTDCLLKRGALRVYALDVGYGLLDWKLRNDRRVILMERCNVRHVKPENFPEAIDIMTVDLSFISLKKAIPPLKKIMKQGEMLLLVKPQFEVGQKYIGKGGIVRDIESQRKAVEEIISFCENLEIDIKGVVESSLKGAEGNREFFLYAAINGESLSPTEISDMIERIFYEKD